MEGQRSVHHRDAQPDASPEDKENKEVGTETVSPEIEPTLALKRSVPPEMAKPPSC